MDYKIIVSRPWRYRHPSRGMQELAAGAYRVPEDIVAPVAARALAEGMATRARLSIEDAERLALAACDADRRLAEWELTATTCPDVVAEEFEFHFARDINGRRCAHSVRITAAKLSDPRFGLQAELSLALTEASARLIREMDRTPSNRRAARSRGPSPRNKMLPGAPANKQALA